MFRIALLSLVLTACASQPQQPPRALPQPIDDTGIYGVAVDAGEAYVTGQPDADALRRLAADGVTTIVNLRTSSEMDDREKVPYDEAALASELGLEYIHLPIGGDDHPYRPEVVAGLAQAIDNAPGKVVLHCASAGRATQVWMAYLIEHEGLSPAEATRQGQAINLSALPLEKLLGRDVHYEVSD